jgi:hypothetical protein
MSLLRRAARLESLAVSETIRREGAAFRQWLRELSREEGLVFLDFCLPTLVAHNAAPPYMVLPSQMTSKERAAYGEALLKWTAERKERGEVDLVAEHRMSMDVWRRFVQRSAGGSRSQQVA